MDFEAVDQLTDAQTEDLLQLYEQEWWTKGRGRADVRRMLVQTGVLVGFCEPESKRLVAFARVLTDGVYKALVLDVIVAASHRGRGLGRALIDALVDHPKLKTVRHVELYCLPELVPFYRQWGFTDDLGELRFLRRTHPSKG